MLGFEVENNIESIRSKLVKACDSYYDDNTSIMSDEDFDILKDKLEKLSPNDKFLSNVGSKSKASEWNKAKHKIAMGSLNKCKTIEEVAHWINSNSFNKHIIISEKLDGISIDLEYENGILVSAITRGNGIEGDEIIDNVILMKNVKLQLPDEFTGSLRGEVLFKQDDFNAVNKILRDNDEKELKTMRNGASGVAKRFDHKYSEFLTIIYYDVTGEWATKQEQLYLIQEKFGLEVVSYIYLTDDIINNITTIYSEYQSTIRKELEYQIDGLVIEIDDRRVFNDIGLINNRPKGAMALKFESMTAETTIIDVVWDIGNSGRITPIAVFNPVQIDGTIQRASLHNLEIFNSFNFRVNDKILIKKANDIIPQVVKVLQHSDLKQFVAPSECPICHSDTITSNKYLECSNASCAGKEIGNIKKWCSAIGLQTKGIGEKFIERMYNEGIVKLIPNLYELEEIDISKLEGYGIKSAKKIINLIKSNTEVELSQFIGGLNIPNFGRRMTEVLIEAGYDSYLKIEKLEITDLIAIKGIEEKTATKFFNEFHNKIDLIMDLFGIGIKIKTVNMDKKLSFCFTGAITSVDSDGKRYTRGVLTNIVNENGGEVISGVKKGLDYLVMADPDSQSTKAKKARKLGIKLIGETEFFEMFNK